ncbi:MAG: nucleoside-diphosphate kinase [Candidatus Dormibacteria bacterium]|jgi:nucleoside-diphosphate kinase
MTAERTLVLVKPDGVQRGLVGEIIGRLERRGLHLTGLKLMRIDESLASRHYAEHVGKPFYPSLVDFISSGPVVAMVWEGRGAVRLVRSTMGATNPVDAAPGTIRGDLAVAISTNVVHGSDSVERAEVEVALFFRDSELVDWGSDLGGWVDGGS